MRRERLGLRKETVFDIPHQRRSTGDCVVHSHGRNAYEKGQAGAYCSEKEVNGL